MCVCPCCTLYVRDILVRVTTCAVTTYTDPRDPVPFWSEVSDYQDSE